MTVRALDRYLHALAFTLGANGVAQLVMAARGVTGLIAGLVLAAITVPLVAALVHLVKRRRRARVSATMQPRLVLDFGAGQLLDARGAVLAPLQEVSFDKVMQLASSSRALKCRWGKDGGLVVLRGSPFAGGIGPAVDALRARGLAVSG
jgi:hypothetical protein